VLTLARQWITFQELLSGTTAHKLYSCFSWIEVWQRKKRQYVCPPGRRQRLEVDDLREARCQDRNNESLIDVLKEEVECGWGSRGPATGPSWVLEVAVINYTLLRLLGYGVHDRLV
jgi:hypothetical protein